MSFTSPYASLIDPKSEIALSENLDVFRVPPTQVLTERQWFSRHYPIAKPSANDHLQFAFRTSPSEYVDLSQTFLKLRLKVILTGTSLTNDHHKKISFVNYPLESIFAQKDLYLNNKKITSSNIVNGYRSSFDAEFFFGKRAKETWLKTANYVMDNYHNKPDQTQSGYIGKEIELMGLLHFDIALQERLLLGGLNYQLNLVPNSPNFYLKLDGQIPGYKVDVTFEKAELLVCRTKVSDALLEAHMAALTYERAKYPIIRSEIKNYVLPSGISTFNQENVFSGYLPKKLFVVFIENSAFKGSLLKDPYFFHNYDVEHIAAVTGSGMVPNNGYQLNFGNDDYHEAYLGLFMALGQLNDDPRVTITPTQFKDGKTIFAFSLLPGSEEGHTYNRCTNPRVDGSVRIDVKFRTPLASTAVMLVYALHDSMVYIDKNFEVTTDYQ